MRAQEFNKKCAQINDIYQALQNPINKIKMVNLLLLLTLSHVPGHYMFYLFYCTFTLQDMERSKLKHCKGTLTGT